MGGIVVPAELQRALRRWGELDFRGLGMLQSAARTRYKTSICTDFLCCFVVIGVVRSALAILRHLNRETELDSKFMPRYICCRCVTDVSSLICTD